MSQSTGHSVPADSLPSPKERRRLREARALTEEQVADALGVTRATVRSWETGRSKPRGRKLEAYVKLLSGDDTAFAPSGEAPDAAPAPSKTSAPQPGRDTTRPKAAAKRVQKPPTGPAPRPKTTARPAEAPSPEPAAAAPPPEAPAPAAQARLERLKPESAEATARPEPAAEPAVAAEPGLTPEGAFDALYAYAAPGLVHQTYLLTGRRRLSRESVERAFHHAWQHWPEVARDRDPVGWVRAAAYEYALSPWHRLRRAHRHPDAPPTEAGRRALLAALLELPPPYRRTVLLYDGLGLDLPETAAETEASTPAAGNRLLYARTLIGTRIPELADPDALHERLRALVAEAPTVSLAPARTVRGGSERRIRLWTRTTFVLTATLIGATAFTLHTAPTQYQPEVAPGRTVDGVPVRGGPPKLGPEDEKLRELLHSRPHHGPERLLPETG
ncbi:transcriptional regulator [Streptomyces solicathayae]|uniref:Helix-turn-helix domain-containing protein n=1 Tax=Streptomyces solicathayae TaxID=3081768 RepID=A0ABZ0LSW6_9ACTN|nr:helix-turn-helix domain-containing protein [Streptomyces sp. HUAS YS2]WOX22578.1 helix-turn-helix domain-containing protein [Streptomyces sp. HUAS YS2]